VRRCRRAAAAGGTWVPAGRAIWSATPRRAGRR